MGSVFSAEKLRCNANSIYGTLLLLLMYIYHGQNLLLKEDTEVKLTSDI